MLLSSIERNLIEEVIYKKWTKVDRAEMTTVKTSSANFVNNLIIWLKKFKTHNFIAKAQSSYLKQLKNKMKAGEFIIIGDYLENYSFVTQDAIQACHWNNAQATIHPFVIYYKNLDDDELGHFCFSVICDHLIHDTSGVYLFQKKLISLLKEKFPGVVKYYFSDGAAGQYKNKKNFVNLANHEKDFGVLAEWHFFATSHGKGPCDGVGGTIKRLAAYASLQGRQISSPKELYDWAISNVKGIIFSFTIKEEHAEEATLLNDRFVGLKPFQEHEVFTALLQ